MPNNKHQSELIELLCEIIKQKKLIHFYYESDNGKNKDYRKVEPYLTGIKDNGKGNIFFTGYFWPDKDQLKQGRKADQKQYLLNKIDINKFEILNETFHALQVDPEKIYNTPTIEVICRVKI